MRRTRPDDDPALGDGLRAIRAAWVEAGGDERARDQVLAALAGAGGIDPGRPSIALPARPPGIEPADLLGLALDELTGADHRRRRGVHHTPRAVAERLVAVAATEADGAVTTACDASVGGGAFLLAVARRWRAAGRPAEAVLAGLYGVDIDPRAVRVTRWALRAWALAAGADDRRSAPLVEARIVVGDGLAVGPRSWGPVAPPSGFDLVVGNPPFLSQLDGATARSAADRRRLAQRFGAAARGYVDDAGLFLLAGLDLVRSGGVVALLLPEPFLAARDAAEARRVVGRRGALAGLWVAGAPVFAADVRVCAPVVRVGASAGSTVAGPALGPGSRDRPAVRLWLGPGLRPLAPAAAAPGDDPFVGLLAAASGTPAPHQRWRTDGVLGDLASATAGFRDQFYGLAPHVVDAVEGSEEADAVDGGEQPDRPRLVTAGAIDPLACRWGERPTRFAGRTWQRPVVDRAALAREAPTLARWVDDRLVPKVVVAPQTRVVEAAIDVEGAWVPSVPVVAVTPLDRHADRDQLWPIAAALLAPAASAWALGVAGGAGLGAGTIKLSARQLLALPLPAGIEAWTTAAAGLQAATLDAATFAAHMNRAYGLAEDDEVGRWWLDRLPSWPVGARATAPA